MSTQEPQTHCFVSVPAIHTVERLRPIGHTDTCHAGKRSRKNRGRYPDGRG